MAITAALVKELRERTGSGMMECKRALVETDGDIEAAIETMRKSGQAKADKKSNRTTAEGIVIINNNADNSQSVIVEINCETDFVAKDENFQSFANSIATTILESKPTNVAELSKINLANGSTVEETRAQLISKIGENVSIRRFETVNAESGNLASYIHGNKIGVVVAVNGGTSELSKDLAMHIAASKPTCITADEVPEEMITKERNIAIAQAESSGKPANIIEKMVEGKIRKFIDEITLLGQKFIKDNDLSVEKLLAKEKAQVTKFIRYEVGEGIEKKQENFADEVMAQVKSI